MNSFKNILRKLKGFKERERERERERVKAPPRAWRSSTAMLKGHPTLMPTVLSIIFSALMIAGVIFLPHSFIKSNVAYSAACSDFNNDQSTCQATPGCSYPANLGDCSPLSDSSSCTAHVGCSVNNFDCSSLSDGGGDGSSCNVHSGCSYDNGSGSCSGTPFDSCSGNYDDGQCTGIYDNTPPILVSFNSSTVDGTYGTGSTINITANFDETLNSGSTMTVVLDSSASVILDQVSGSKISGTYTVVNPQTSLNLTVASITSASITDLASNHSTNYSVPSSPNNIADASVIVINTTVPGLSNATVNGNTLTLTYDRSLNTGSVPNDTEFTLSGTSATIFHISVTGSTVVLTLTRPVVFTDSISLDYLKSTNPIQDVFGNTAESFSNQSVQNTTLPPAIPVGTNPIYSSIVGSKVYVTNQIDGTVSVIDSLTDIAIATIPVGTAPLYSSVLGTKVYVSNSSSNSVSVIDTTNTSGSPGGTVIATIPVGTAPLYSSVLGTKVYVSNSSSNSVSVIDTTNTSGSPGGTVIATIPVGNSPYGSTVVGTKVYVGSTDSNAISVIDSTSNTLSSITVGDHPYYSSVVGTKVYVNNYFSNSVSVIDTKNTSGDPGGTVIATIPVGNSPYGSTVVGTKVYLINSGFPPTASVIDTTNTSGSPGGTVIATIPVGNIPFDSSVVGSKVYVTNQNDNSVSVIDTTNTSGSPGGTVIATIPLGTSPFDSSVVGTKVYVINQNDNTLSVVDSSTDTLLNVDSPHLLSLTSSASNGTYTATSSPINLTANFNKSLGAGSKMRLTLNTGAVVNLTTISGSTLSGTYNVGGGESSPDLSVSSISTNPTYTSASDTSSPANTQSSFSIPISPDLTGDTPRNLGDLKNIVIGTPPLTIPVGTNPYQMVTVGNLTYVANQGSDNVTIFNNITNTVIGTTTVGSQPYGMAYNSTSKEIYVANLKRNSVSVIDADPNSGTWKQVTHTITSDMGVEPYYVASLGTKIYVTNNLSWTVSEIDTTSHTVTGTASVGANPRGIKALGTKLYVANFGSQYGGNAPGTVSIIDTANSNAVTTVNVGSGPRGVAVNGTDVYVANFNDNTVSRIDTANSNAVTTINVGTNPRGILALNNKIYVENYQDGTINIIDGTTHAVTGPYKVGNTPAGMAPIGNDIAISRFTDNVVDIFDTTNLVLKVAADTTPPAISSIVSFTTQTTATITWTTDENASSTVNYGANTSYGTGSTSDTLVTSHSVTLSGLTAGTTYHFQVASADASGNVATSTDYVFTTTANTNSGGGSGGSSGGGSVVGYATQPLIPINTLTNPAQTTYSFTATLKQGDIGNNQILELQKFLNTHLFVIANTGAGSPGHESNYFGLKTKKALTSFQIAHGIKPASGLLGPLTRKMINDIMVSTSSPLYPNPVASTTPALCTTSLYLTAPVKYGAKNNRSDVKLLETFLNTYQGANLPATGIYSKADYDAVVKFQEKYASIILTPWHLKKGTGYVFTTTLDQIKRVVEENCKK